MNILRFFIIFTTVFSVHADSKNSGVDSSCQFKFDDFCLTVNFEDKISRKKSSDFTLSVLKRGEVVKLTEAPQMKLWMRMNNGHEHGSEKLEIKLQDNGDIKVSNVWFLMRGEWQIMGSLMLESKKKDFSVPVCVGKTPSDSQVGSCQ